jgi:hypothetical protein
MIEAEPMPGLAVPALAIAALPGAARPVAHPCGGGR